MTGYYPSGVVTFGSPPNSTGTFTPYGLCTLSSGSCSATFVGAAPGGTVRLTASYGGDSNNSASSGSVAITVKDVMEYVLNSTNPNVGKVCADIGGSWEGNTTCEFSGTVPLSSKEYILVLPGIDLENIGKTTDSAIINDSGGNVSNSGVIDIEVGGSILNSVYKSQCGVITNAGTIINLGNIGNYCTFTNEDSLTNSGLIDALGGSIINDGSITNNARGTIMVDNGLAGTLSNSGTITINKDGFLDLYGGDNVSVVGSVAGLSVFSGSFNSTGPLTMSSGSTLAVGRSGIGTTLEIKAGNFTIPSGVTLYVNDSGRVSVDAGASLENKGQVIINSSVVTNNGIINNEASGTMTINTVGTIVNNVGGTVTNSGTLANSGTITNGGLFVLVTSGKVTNKGGLTNTGTITSSGSITNTASGAITNENGGNLTNSGTITNSGFIISNSGCIITNNPGGTITNVNGFIFNTDSTITNNPNGTISNEFYGTIENTNEGTITNAGNIVNSGTFTSNGAFTNKGTITNNPGSTITNSLAITNNGTLANSGAITSSGTLTNSLAITNNPGGTITIPSTGIVANDFDSAITNNGAISIEGTLTNNGTIIDNSGGVINNHGQFVNEGILDNCGGQVARWTGSGVQIACISAQAGRASVTSGSVSIQYFLTTGMSVSISRTNGTTIGISTAREGSQPSETPMVNFSVDLSNMGIIPPQFFDLSIFGANNGTADVCIYNTAVSSPQTVIEYYSSGSWSEAIGVSATTGINVCGSIPVAALIGSPLVIGNSVSSATTSSTTSTSSSTASTTRHTTTSTSSSTTSTSSSPTTFTTTSTTSSTTSTNSSSTTTITSTETSSSSTVIPEFPYQLLIVSVFTTVVVVSYLLVRHRANARSLSR